MKRLVPLPLLLTLLAAGLLASSASAATIRVQSTTDTIDAGLVDGLLKDAYEQAQPGDTLQYVGVGTGKALDNAKAGLADVVITHAPSLEQQFVDQGYSLEPYGRAIFYSDYVLVGPTGDPAHVADTVQHDAIAALERIAAAGTDGTANFVARGDNSGTNVQEQIMWGMTGAPLVKQLASNGGGAPTRYEPGTGGTLPSWYHKTNKGQAANLQETAVCNTDTYPGGGCYTMVDRGTFNRVSGQGLISNLKIVGQLNAPEARGGQDLLINPFHAYVVNPDKVPGVDVAAGLRFVDFLTSPGFQAAVSGFPSAGDPAFRPDAFPAVTVSTPPPAVAQAGDTITLSANLENRLPGAGVLAGIPVQLQQSTDGGATWADDDAPVPTDGAGHVVFTTRVNGSTSYRVTTQRFRDLSPTSAALGHVSVARPTTTTPKPPPPVDRTRTTVSKVTLARRLITLTVNEATTVRATVARKVTRKVRRKAKTHTVTSYVTTKRVTTTARKAGKVRLAWKHAIPRGSYRLTLRATDRAGNVRTRTVALRVK